MFSGTHPRDTVILAVLNGTAPESEAQFTRRHISRCSKCAALVQEYRLLLGDISSYAGDKPALRAAQTATSWNPATALTRPTFRWTAAVGVGATVLLAFLLLWAPGTQSVRAGELLSRAELAERERAASPRTVRAYRFREDAITCSSRGAAWRAAAVAANDPCGQIRNVLLRAEWDTADPLSIHAYKRWHDSLGRSRDVVTHVEPYWAIRTEIPTGFLSAATLRVQSSTYSPVEVRLEFAGLKPISIVEDDSADSSTQTAELDSAAGTDALDAAKSTALDEAEVRAWVALHSAGVDSGWDAAVLRTKTSVSIATLNAAGVDNDSAREALSQVPGLRVEIEPQRNLPSVRAPLWPQRLPTGDFPPLSEAALEDHFVDAAERSRFVNQISSESRAVVGMAFEYENLVKRRAALSVCPLAVELDPILVADRTRLHSATADVAASLSELLGPIVYNRAARPVSYREAQEIDVALQSLFNSAPQSPEGALETKIQTVRKLLAARPVVFTSR